MSTDVLPVAYFQKICRYSLVYSTVLCTTMFFGLAVQQSRGPNVKMHCISEHYGRVCTVLFCMVLSNPLLLWSLKTL